MDANRDTAQTRVISRLFVNVLPIPNAWPLPYASSGVTTLAGVVPVSFWSNP